VLFVAGLTGWRVTPFFWPLQSMARGILCASREERCREICAHGAHKTSESVENQQESIAGRLEFLSDSMRFAVCRQIYSLPPRLKRYQASAIAFEQGDAPISLDFEPLPRGGTVQRHSTAVVSALGAASSDA